MVDICIIGGGASGMVAAITAKEHNPSAAVCILEKKERLGKKLSATGNGKCNLSNSSCPNVKLTVDFFYKLGVIVREDDQGRLYPYTEQAKDLVYALEKKLKQLNVGIETGTVVKSISRKGSCFEILSDKGIFAAKSILLALGGKAAPQLGTAGDGYQLAQSLGHEIKRLAPVLTAMECQGNFKMLKGLRAKGQVALWKDGHELSREQGEIQFTEDGLSGICIFNLSRQVKIEKGESFVQGLKRYRVVVDFMPDRDQGQVEALLIDRQKSFGLSSQDLLLTIVPKNLAVEIMNGVKSASDIAERLKGWSVSISGMKGWKNAQCTAGGVSLEEINMETMESKLVKNLYFAGELIDYDGPCGGYNLQNAWETGMKAGRAIKCTE